MFTESMGWAVVLPVKMLERAKTRLLPPDDPTRPELALAFLQDVLAALGACRRVELITVVTDDERVRTIIDQTPHHWAAEDGPRGLNAAALIGARLTPAGLGTAIIAADLPCLTSTAIDHVLTLAQQSPRSFLADTEGIGTTMLMSHISQECTPTFGVRSRAWHSSLGYIELGLDSSADDRRLLARAHRDVDTPVDLWDALRIGVGPVTGALLSARLGR